jgi:DnaJ-domain-containing protein 1
LRDEKEKILPAAAMLARFRAGRQLDDGYHNVFESYETLLDIIGGSHTAQEICRLLKTPEAEIRTCAGQIVDLLLFNRGNDPYVSLGLPGRGTAEEVNRRWKSLILLYHPDKYANQRDYEERAKKINEAYERIRSANRNVPGVESPAPLQKVKVRRLPGSGSLRHFRPLRYLPDIILALVVMTAVISALILIGSLRHSDTHSRGYGQTASALK